MIQITHQGIFIFCTVLTILLLYLLAPILTPFLLGALLAYLMDPLVKFLDKRKVPHLLSVTIIFISFLLAFVLFILMLIPLIQSQVVALLDAIPEMSTWLQNTLVPWFSDLVNINVSFSAIKSSVSSALPAASSVFSTVVNSGYTLIQVTINFVLTPIVTFYFLRDWDKIRENIKRILPKRYKPTIIKFASECDEVLSAFFRGQLLVMLSLCIIYGVGLTIIGLRLGLILGVIGGLLSIVPYLGSLFVFITASLSALVQFGTWQGVAGAVIVFMIGQAFEGYVLTPYFVGSRIGLHPVVVIFSIMAGGVLFGFFGVLLALPVAAVIKVFLRFIRERYHPVIK